MGMSAGVWLIWAMGSVLPRTYDLAAWRTGYQTARSEDSYTVKSTDLPKDLVGTFYKNGPAKFELPGGERIALHPFDGDGMLASCTLDGEGSAHFRNRFVRTRGYVREEMAGKALYAGEFSSPRPIWDGGLTRKNKANTNVMYWGGRLLALWEAGKPHLMDEVPRAQSLPPHFPPLADITPPRLGLQVSLATSRETDLGGVLKPGDQFSAHPRYDVARGRLVNFQYQPNPLLGTTKLTFWEFDRSFRPVNPEKPRMETSIKGFCLVHDIALTASYYVVTQAPTTLKNRLDLLTGSVAAGQCIHFDDDKPTNLLLIPRDGGKPLSFPVDTHFCFHHANAYEDDQGRVVLDTITVPSLFVGESRGATDATLWDTVDFETVPKPALCRYRLDPSTGRVAKEVLHDRRALDFPSINPRCSAARHRYIWASTGAVDGSAAPFQGVVKIDTETGDQQVWLPEAHEFVGEVVFAAREHADDSSPEDDGYLVAFLHDGKRGKASLVVFDAANVSPGPVARVDLDTYLGHGLHGTWAPSVKPSREDIDRATKLMEMYAKKSTEWNSVDGSFTGLGFKQLFQKRIDGR